MRKAPTGLGSNAAAAIRGIYDGAPFRGAIDRMLPDFAGGVFDA